MVYPASLDDLTTAVPTGGSTDHEEHTLAVATAVEALQAKVGVGEDTPFADEFFIGTGDGESGWVSPATAMNALTSQGVAVGKATVTVSSAQLLDLHNTPVTLVAAPGAGKYVSVHRYAYDYAYGTTAYVVGDAFHMVYGAEVAEIADLSDIVDVDSYHVDRAPNFSMVGTSAALDNLPVVLSANGVAITDGDGDIPAFVAWYTIEDVPA